MASVHTDVENSGHVVHHDHDCLAPDEKQEMEISIPDNSELQQVDVETGFMNCPSALNCEGVEVGSSS